MREDTMAGGRESFQSGLLACVRDINELLPGLSRRYDMVVIISALAEHMGSALRILIRRKVCDVRQARLIIQHIEGTAFLGERAQTPGSTPSGTVSLAPDDAQSEADPGSPALDGCPRK
ncbi:MAG: hypothetical protein JWM63_5439 [Gammaproteobacteria bacterium]|jgi:hypothetical protein|nr:hypothetical protein [Gammaproteobacteria bacterium]